MLDNVKAKEFLNSIRDGCGMQGADGIITYVNPRLCEMLGVKSTELIGSTAEGFLTPESVAIFRKQMTIRKELKPSNYELDWNRKDGKPLKTITSAHPILDENGKFAGSFAIVTDITERALAQQKLQEAERRLETLLDNLPGMAYRCGVDQAWTMEIVSDGCLALTGYASTEFTENKTSFTQLVHSDDIESVRDVVENAKNGRRPFTVVYRIRTKDGETKWVWERGRVIIENDAPAAIEGFIADYSRQKEAEESTLPARIKKNADKLDRFFDICASQAKASFWYCAVAGIVGFSLLVLGVLLLYFWEDRTTEGTLSSVSGILSQAIGAVFLLLYRNSRQQLGATADELRKMQDVILAIDITKQLPPKEQPETQKSIVKHLLERRKGGATNGTSMADTAASPQPAGSA